jgi:hypothetical protein
MQDLDLPPSDTVRWSPRRKASVVRGVRSGAISLEEACQRYRLSAEEFLAWQEAIEAHGSERCASPGPSITGMLPSVQSQPNERATDAAVHDVSV